MDFDAPFSSGYYVSFDQRLIDPAFVIKEIQGSYWGNWRSPMVILRSMDHSICAGVYQHTKAEDHEDFPTKDEMVGFGRVVTDYTTFAWICDIIITEGHRHKGLGSFLMHSIMSHPEVAPRACLLATRDAHELYRKFGFENVSMMKRLPNPKAG